MSSILVKALSQIRNLLVAFIHLFYNYMSCISYYACLFWSIRGSLLDKMISDKITSPPDAATPFSTVIVN